MKFTRRLFSAALLSSGSIFSISCTSKLILHKRQKNRPNIITIILDDVGFSDFGCFGSEILTPNIDRIAKEGLRFNRFDTKAICSATRAAFLTGRNNHTINMPTIPDFLPFLNFSPPADIFRIPRNAKTFPQVLQLAGYSTWGLGKWHILPPDELNGKTQHTWPCQRGFDHFYGFLGGWCDQYNPSLVEDNEPIEIDRTAGYHLSSDLVAKLNGLINESQIKNPAKPFFANLAFGAAHAPIQVPREYSKKYDDVYAEGWDKIRLARYNRMLANGIIPASTKLSERTPDDKAWDDLTEEEQTVFARYMAVYAGFIEHCDEQIGKLLDTLDALGIADDTIVMVFSDNGAAGEAGPQGAFEELYKGDNVPIAEQLERIDEIGTDLTHSEYPRPWALASDAPLRRYKTWPFAGGIRTPLIVRWPSNIRDAGAIRDQYIDVVDLAPTLLEAAGATFPLEIEGQPEVPVAGRSFLAAFDNPQILGRQAQFFELHGSRAITDGKWRAVCVHECGKQFDDDEWQLFDTENDFSETADLSSVMPERLQAMKSLWTQEWSKYSTYPLMEIAPACLK